MECQDHINEKHLGDDIPKVISLEFIKKVFEQMRKSLCKIKSKNGRNGTGFLCNIPKIHGDSFRVLITNNHILEEKDIIIGNKINILLNNDKINKEIKMDELREKYTNIKYDITIIEIKPNDGINVDSFIELDDDIFKNNSKELFNKINIYLLYYFKGEAGYSIGKVESINEDNFTMLHLCDSKEDSSGGPLINMNNYKVIGIHKGGLKVENYNCDIYIKEPIEEFLKNIKEHNDNKSMDEFKPKIDFNNCLTNVACSIQKYFDIPQRHKTLPEVDRLFEEKKPENVILILCDGLGSRVMDVILKKEDFMMKKRIKEIYSTFPPTTAAGLTSTKTGLNPAEHGWIGWFTYIKKINKIVKIYKDKDKDAYIFSNNDFIKIKEKYLTPKTIVEQINEAGKYKAFETNCYPYNEEKNLDIVFQNILDKLKIEGKKYIFSYIGEPDHVLHSKGTNSEQARKEIEKINRKVEEYSKKIIEYKNTVIIMVADHGHIVGEDVEVKNKEFLKYVANEQLFIECRSPAYLVKKGQEENFKKAFLKDFGKDFYLLSKEEVLKHKLFGDYEEGNENPLFKDGLGDFMGISKGSSNKVLLGKGDWGNVGYHGGYSDEEIFVPLIIISD